MVLLQNEGWKVRRVSKGEKFSFTSTVGIDKELMQDEEKLSKLIKKRILTYSGGFGATFILGIISLLLYKINMQSSNMFLLASIRVSIMCALISTVFSASFSDGIMILYLLKGDTRAYYNFISESSAFYKGNDMDYNYVISKITSIIDNKKADGIYGLLQDVDKLLGYYISGLIKEIPMNINPSIEKVYMLRDELIYNLKFKYITYEILLYYKIILLKENNDLEKIDNINKTLSRFDIVGDLQGRNRLLAEGYRFIIDYSNRNVDDVEMEKKFEELRKTCNEGAYKINYQFFTFLK